MDHTYAKGSFILHNTPKGRYNHSHMTEDKTQAWRSFRLLPKVSEPGVAEAGFKPTSNSKGHVTNSQRNNTKNTTQTPGVYISLKKKISKYYS